MKTIEIKTYGFSELNSEIQAKIIRNHEVFTDFIYEEAKKTVDKFCEIFGINTSNNSWVEFGYTSNTFQELTGLRLRTYILNNFYNSLYKPKYLGHLKGHSMYSKVQKDNNCVLTGVCYDIDLMKPLYEFLEGKSNNTTIEDIFIDCFNSLSKCIKKEVEYRNSTEAIIEDIESMDLIFTENGKEITL